MFYFLLTAAFFLAAPLFSIDKLIIGIAGGSGSGKTTLAKKIQNTLPTHSVLICQDNYYKDFSKLSFEERENLNFDHPDSLDFSLLRQHILDLKEGKTIKKPIYNFKSHVRESFYELVEPVQLVIIEGILIFAMPEVRDLFDIKIFIDADEDIRLLRRMERDIKERARDFYSIKNQYLETVKPMFDAFVKPSKKYADVIVPRGGENANAFSFIISKLKHELALNDEKKVPVEPK